MTRTATVTTTIALRINEEGLENSDDNHGGKKKGNIGLYVHRNH